MQKPKLSFGYPEQYKVVRLSEIATPNARIGWQNLRRSEFMDSGDAYIITGTDFENGIVNFKGCKFVDLERYEMDDKIKVRENDILITKDGTIGKVAIVKGLHGKATLNAGVFILNNIYDVVCREYLYHYLRSQRLLKFVKSSSTGGTIQHLNQSVLLNFPVALPSLKEQQEVAAFFTALDEKIRLSKQKLTLISKIKKGITKNIFSKDVRFKNDEGSFFKPWESHTVGELAEVIGGGTPSTQNQDYWNGEIYWLTPTEINSKYVHPSNRKITSYGLSNSSAKLLPKGALLLTTRATIGSCSINNQDNRVCTNVNFL